MGKRVMDQQPQPQQVVPSIAVTTIGKQQLEIEMLRNENNSLRQQLQKLKEVPDATTE